MSSDIVSIIIPAKNAGKFLPTTLSSILRQSIDDWELIVVNDNSEDDTSEILYKYAKKDNRILVLNNKGNGIIDALNTGYEASSGTYITRMDADDIMPTEKLEKLREALKNKEHSVSTGYVSYFSLHGMSSGYLNYEKWLNSLCDQNNHFKEIYKECVIPSPCWMMSRSTFESIGAFRDLNYPEDYDLVFRMYKNKITVVPICEVLHEWRDHPDRASRTDDNYKDNRFLELKLKYFVEIECPKFRLINLIGAGKKGKKIAEHLTSEKVNFHWYTNNENKIGRNIYGNILKDYSHWTKEENTVTVITVANPVEQAEIKERIQSLGMKNYFFFT